MVFFKLKTFSGDVAPIYKAVVGFLPVPVFKTLSFSKSLSLLQACLVFGTQSNCPISNLLVCSCKPLKT